MTADGLKKLTRKISEGGRIKNHAASNIISFHSGNENIISHDMLFHLMTEKNYIY
jgi:hypothetical protein